jgi:Putative DNA-binding domain
MLSLLEVQRAMRRALLGEISADVLGFIAPGGELAPDERVSIYRNNLLHALTQTLRLTFPAVLRMVGDDFFDSMAGTFARRSPPRSAWLDDYGEGFPDFLASFEPARVLPYLPDLARLEWTVAKASRAEAVAAVSPRDLAFVASEDAARLSFVTHPSLQMLESGLPVDDLWRAALDGDEARLAQVDLGAGPVHVMVRQAEWGAEVVRLDEPGARFTRLLLRGAPLGAALEEVPEEAGGRTLAVHLSGASFRGFRLLSRIS